MLEISLLKAIDSAGSVSEEELEKLIIKFSSTDNSLKNVVFDLIARNIIIKV